MNWIYCFEKMPTPYTQVLVAYKSKRGLNIARAEYCKSVGHWRNIDTSEFLSRTKQVYAWTYLLTPPEFKE